MWYTLTYDRSPQLVSHTAITERIGSYLPNSRLGRFNADRGKGLYVG
jgi:hypothetical protein